MNTLFYTWSGFRIAVGNAAGRSLSYAVGACEVGTGIDLRAAKQVSQVEAVCRNHGARQGGTAGAQNRRNRGLGISLRACQVGPFGNRAEAIRAGQTVGRFAGISRVVLRSPSLL